ncbi:hypothetical protein ACHHV8_35050 [Paenibacillus sp. TAB 01]|uniref:hypothetical protein n=1 Tax=Paenibacillus sp. TAB 01 TaxID=3368988 RepID=UPI003750AC56
MLTKRRARRLAGMFLFLLMSCMVFSAYASDTVIEPPFRHWSNGAHVTVGSAGGETRVTSDTHGLKKGYYTTYVFEAEKRNWSADGELSVPITNESGTPLKLNVIVTLADGTNLTLTDKSNVMVESLGSGRQNLQGLTYGSLELAGRFEGTVHVPFSSLHVQGGAGGESRPELDSIVSWGLTTNLEEEGTQSFRIGRVQLVPAAQAAISNELGEAVLQGDLQVVKPYIGESIAEYSLQTKSAQLKETFKLEKAVKGASLTPDGRLTLTPEISEDSLSMYVDIDGRWRKDIDVKLVPSWTLSAKQQDGTSLSIPETGQMSKVMEKSDPLLKPDMLISLRIVIVAAGAGIGLLYLGWRQRFRSK